MAVSWKKETNSSVVTLIPKFNTERAVISNVSERRTILLHPERRCKIGCNSSIGRNHCIENKTNGMAATEFTGIVVVDNSNADTINIFHDQSKIEC